MFAELDLCQNTTTLHGKLLEQQHLAVSTCLVLDSPSPTDVLQEVQWGFHFLRQLFVTLFIEETALKIDVGLTHRLFSRAGADQTLPAVFSTG